MNTTATIRMEDYEKRALTELAAFQGMSFSEWARKTLCEAYEDYMDVKIADAAYEEHLENPKTYTLAEAISKLGDD